MIHEYHERQYRQIYDQTERLFEFIDETVGGVKGQSILDVACGAGANVFHMLRRWPMCKVTGLDRDETLLDYGRAQVLPEAAARCDYVQANFFDLPEPYASEAFNITTFMHTLLFFGPDEYAGVLQRLISVSSDWVFISSLFTDKRMDVMAQIRDYARFGEDSKEYHTYSTFCVDRFRRVAAALGVKEVIFRDFEISIDLEGPEEGGIGTYTAKLADGHRLQFSGAVFMPWKFAALRLR